MVIALFISFYNMALKNKNIDLTPINKERPLLGRKKKRQTNVKNIEFEMYKKEVWDKTNETSHLIKDVHTRGFKTFHIDHKISIYYGFKHNIPTEHIAHTSNLRMLGYKENMLKNKKCFIDDENRWIIEDNSVN